LAGKTDARVFPLVQLHKIAIFSLVRVRVRERAGDVSKKAGVEGCPLRKTTHYAKERTPLNKVNLLKRWRLTYPQPTRITIFCELVLVCCFQQGFSVGRWFK